MPTLNLATGKWIEGLDDLWQSIATILETPRGTRVMRRRFGSELPRLVDRAMNPMTLIEWYAAVPDALNAEEPRFRLTRTTLVSSNDNGHNEFEIIGIYYPRGHLGDYSEARDARGRIVVSDTDRVMVTTALV